MSCARARHLEPSGPAPVVNSARFSMSLTPPRLRRGGVPASTGATAGVWGRGPKVQTWDGSEAAPPAPPKREGATRFGSWDWGPRQQPAGDPKDQAREGRRATDTERSPKW